MITEKLALRPTAAQGRRLEAMAHAYREARNWALSEWERQYRDPSARVVDPSTGEVLLEVPVVDGGVLPALSRNQAVADVEVAYRRWWDALKRGDRRIRRPRPRRASARPWAAGCRVMCLSAARRASFSASMSLQRVLPAFRCSGDGRPGAALGEGPVRAARRSPGGARPVGGRYGCQATSGIDPPATPKTDPSKKRRMLLKWWVFR